MTFMTFSRDSAAHVNCVSLWEKDGKNFFHEIVFSMSEYFPNVSPISLKD